MRIDIVAPSRFPVRQPCIGGLESFVWHLARRLTQRGHQVVLYAHPDSDPQICAELVALPQYRAGRWTQGGQDAADVRAYRAVVERLITAETDLVHNNTMLPTLPELSRLIPAPMLTTLHTPPLPPMITAFAHADPRHRVVAVSRAMAKRWPVPRIEVLANGVDTDMFTPGPGGHDLVWVGRITPEKGTHLAIEAARRLGVPLRLAGTVYDQDYFDAAVAPRLGGQVSYLGPVAQPDLPAVYGTAAVTLVTPCWDEPFGLVAAESLACGTPVAALRRGGLPEVVRHQVTGVLCRSVAALPAAARAASRLNRDRVADDARHRLSLDRMVERYEALYLRMGGLASEGVPVSEVMGA